MIPIIHFRGFSAIDPLDQLKPVGKAVSILTIATVFATALVLFFGKTNIVLAEGWADNLALGSALLVMVALSGGVFSKNASHATFGALFLGLFSVCLLLRKAGIGWSYPSDGTMPILVFSGISAVVCGPLALWFIRLLAKAMPGKVPTSEPDNDQYRSLFKPEWSEEAMPPKPKGFLPFVLKSLGFFYLIYLMGVVLGGFGRGHWESPVMEWVELNYANPVLASITFVKLTLMFLLASLAAHNKGLRQVCGWLLAGGHLVSVAGSLLLFFITNDVDSKNFLLASAVADGLVAVLAAWAAIRYRAEGKDYLDPQKFPDFYSVPHRLMTLLLVSLATVYTLVFLFVVGARLLLPETDPLAGVFHRPDPLVVNAMTRYATLAAVFFITSLHERLREALSVVIRVCLLVSVVGNLTMAFASPEHTTLLLGSAIIDFALLMAYTRIRAMFYRVEYGISYFGAESAQSIMAFHEAVFGAKREDSSNVLKTLDAYAGGIKGRKRGLLNFPFLLLEHTLPFLFLKPGFSTMDQENRRWFVRKKLLRSPMERKLAAVPTIAGLANALGTVAHGLISMANFDQLKTRGSVGYVPPEVRDRLAGGVAKARPPFDQELPLPASPLDPANYQPAPSGPYVQKLSTRISVPVREPDLPDEADYVILGSGAGGAVMAYRLAKTDGIDPQKILLLDRGLRYSPMQDFNDRELEMYMKLYKEGGLQTTKRFDLTILQGECVGGSTVVNNAICLKMPPHVKQKWENEFDLDLSGLDAAYDQVATELGIKTIPANALNERVEDLFKTGVASYNAQYPSDGLVYQVLESNHFNPNGDGLDNLGNKRLEKRSMLESYIPWSEAEGVKVLGGMMGVNFVADGRRATQVLVRTGAGAMKTVKVKKALIVAGGAIASTHFLMRSEASDHAGKYLACNFALPFNFHFPQELKAFDGLQIGLAALDPKNRAVFETYFNPPAIFSLSLPFFFERQQNAMQQYNNMLSMGALIGSEPNGVVQRKADLINGRAVDWTLGQQDVENLRYGFGHLTALAKHCGADKGYLPLIPGLELPLDQKNFDAFMQALAGFPLTKKTVRLNTAHPQGGNRMCGNNSPHARTRTLDADFRVDGFDNVFVADASVFPTSITVNPQWTIWALATLAAKKVAAV